MRKLILAAAACLGLAMAFAAAQEAQAQRVLPGYATKERVERLTGQINWHRNLQDALADARREGKLVFWVHMLGEIDGAT